nr:MAG: terminase large subunit [Caudoviricetes sp.]
MFRDAVMRGEIPVNEMVSLQMNLIDQLIASPEYYYDDDAIQGFINFAEAEMTLTDGDRLTLLPSFILWAEDLFAWFYFIEEQVYDPEAQAFKKVVRKKRLRNKQYLIVGRGASKSLYDSLIQAYGLTIDTDTTNQIVTAPTMRLADETMGPIRTALSVKPGPLFKFLTDGELRSNTYTKVGVASTKAGIQNFLTNSLIEVRPMRIDKLQGLRSKYNTVDEWLSGHIKEDPIEAIEQGASKIDDYIIVATSSEGTERDGVGDTIKMDLMKKLRGEVFDPHTSIWYYRLDDVTEIADPRMWPKANPNIGATVSYETYNRAVQTAEYDLSKRNDILAKRFGIPVEGLSYFFKYEETLRHRAHSYKGYECALGADLSQGDDFCAFTFLFPLGADRFGIKTRSYVARNKVLKLPGAVQNKYQEFVNEGSLVILEGTILDMKEVYEDLDTYILEQDYVVITLGYDPYNAEAYLNQWVKDNGEFNLEVVRQGFRTESVPLGEIRALARDRRLIFDQELMKWTMGNSIVIEDNNGNLKLSKKRSSEKIDNVAALMDALVAYKRNQEAFA